MAQRPERSQPLVALAEVARSAPGVLVGGFVTELLSGGDGFDILGALEFSAAFAAVVLALKGLGLLWHPSPSKQRFGGAHQVGERSGDRSRQPP